MSYKFYTLDVFTNKPFSGNQLAVFPDAQGLSTEEMTKIAIEFNFSETVFVFPAENSSMDFRVRIFTPGGEIPFAGHPTIGTAYLLAHLQMIELTEQSSEIILGEGVGNVPVTIKVKNGQPIATELKAPNPPEFYDDVPSMEDLAEVLSLSTSDFHPSFSCQAVSCGLPFLIAPLNSLSALSSARINLSAWEKKLKNSIAPHVYPCCPVDDVNWRVRMFAPALNITEDPATGSAATAFAGYLARYQDSADGTFEWQIAQGQEINRPSKIGAIATKQNNQITEIRVKGESVIVTEGKLRS